MTSRDDGHPYLRPVRGIETLRYSAIVDRPTLRWPDDRGLAFWVAPNIEIYALDPAPNDYRTFWTRTPAPDAFEYGLRDYGNRVGFTRMLDVFDRYDIRPSVSLNVGVLTDLPGLIEPMLERGWDIFSHGIYNTEFLFGLDREAEREWVRRNIELVKTHTGLPLRGLFGPALSQNPQSMGIWAEEGIEYVVEWFVDDQPFPIHVPNGSLINVPYGWELNDARMMGGVGFGGTLEADDFLLRSKDQFDTLYEEGKDSGRVMCLPLHPYLIGQPWRIDYLDRALDYVLSHDDVWVTTAGDIAEYYRETPHYQAQMQVEGEAVQDAGPAV